MNAFEWLMDYMYITGSFNVGANWQCPAHADGYPSLSISERDDGGVLIYCHAGCRTSEVVEALGLTMGSLYEPPIWQPTKFLERSVVKPEYADFHWKSSTPTSDAGVKTCGSKPKPELGQAVAVEHHQYTPEVRMERLRYESGHKRIYWQTKVGSRWGKAVGLDLPALPIYRCREVWESMQLGQPIVLCESESSVDALCAAGICATTWAGGASSPPVSKLIESLKDAYVIFIPDNDEAGLKCRDRLNDELRPHVRQWEEVLGDAGEDAKDLLNRGALSWLGT